MDMKTSSRTNAYVHTITRSCVWRWTIAVQSLLQQLPAKDACFTTYSFNFFQDSYLCSNVGLSMWILGWNCERRSYLTACLPFSPSRACHPGLVDDRTKIWHHFKFHDVTVTWPRIWKAASPYSSASSSFALRCPRGCFGFEGLTAVSRSHRISSCQTRPSTTSQNSQN